MTAPRSCLFAVIPAAGRSRRMGQPKLLLPLGDKTVIGRLLETLAAADVETFVLIRPDDVALSAEVAKSTATIVQPEEPPPEMRVSVECLLRAIEQSQQPQADDGWLLIPADHPLLMPETLQRLLEVWQEQGSAIVLPTYGEKRGHPTIFPWSLASAVFELPADTGVNTLVRRNGDLIREVAVDDPTVLIDLDTPADYEQALALIGQ